MASARKRRPEELLEQYLAMQLTPEQKTASRAELEKKVAEASRDGAYQRLREIVGTVKWSVSWEELRDED